MGTERSLPSEAAAAVWFGLAVDAEKAMATYSSTLAWKIPWTEEPGGLQSTGSLGVGPNERLSLSCKYY